MADITAMLQAAAGAIPTAATDPNFNQTVLLLHGDGTNGAQNNTFLDSSTNNFTITRNNNTTQGAFSPFSLPSGYWSNNFDGTNDRLTIADNASLRPGTSNFTIEAWVYRAAAGAAHTVFAKGGVSTGFVFGITSGNVLRFTDTTTNIDSTGTVAANTWVHVAVVREGTGSNQLKLYINGTQDGQGTVSTDFNQTEEARIAENRGATEDFNGWISNFRYVIGSAVYTSAFTPSAAPLTAITDTQLLTCQSNRFVDNSVNAFTITKVNDARITPFSPFSISSIYSSSVNGASGYFDGTNDRLTIADNVSLRPGTGNFTIEAWIYRSVANLANTIYAKGATTPTGFVFAVIATNVLRFTDTSTNIDSTGTIPAGTWAHVAVVREGTGSNQLKLYINGTQDGQGTVSTDFNQTEEARIGENRGATEDFNGYISSFRYVSDAVYTGNFTPPSSPLTAVANTQLLCNFTNAGIFDSTAKNILETVADAQIDTLEKKFGTGSLQFDGTGDALVVSNLVRNFAFGTGDFTVEFFIKSTDTGAGLIGIPTGSAGNWNVPIFGGDIYWQSVFGSSNLIQFSAADILDDNWHHVAFCRSSGTTRLFYDGVQKASAADSNNYTATGATLRIGSDSSHGTLNGYLDEIRVSRVARYTGAFTPPDKAFPDR